MKNPLKSAPPVGCAFQPAPVKSTLLARKDDGSNQHEADFIWSVANFLLTQPQYQNSFSLTDAFQLSKALDLSPDEVRAYFDSWTTKLCRSGILQKIETCYSEDVFKVV